MSERLLSEVRALVDQAHATYLGTGLADDITNVKNRLDGPLRVAFAGKVKAGKSTLLNALVGEQLAQTDVGECTKIVSWYQRGMGYGVALHPKAGAPTPLPFRREDGSLHIDLQGRSPEDIERLVVEWPASSLEEITLIDTPGIASQSEDISERAMRFLAPEDEQETDADAVIYLMRHLHASDRRFLESFHDQEASQPSPVNTIGVLSRADEIGVGRIDAMTSATNIAARYRVDPQIRRLCQTVLPVAGLVAQAAATLREDEYRALKVLADAPNDETEALLVSVDRFAKTEEAFGLLPIERETLLHRFGIFGIRLSISLIRAGQAATAADLADGLSLHSGVNNLISLLDTVFRDRRSVLKSRAALLALRSLVEHNPDPSGALEAEIERVVANAHEIAELRLLNHIRGGQLDFEGDELAALERIVGSGGTDPRLRLGLTASADDAEVQARAIEMLGKWRGAMEHPLTSRLQADAYQIAITSAERIFADLAA